MRLPEGDAVVLDAVSGYRYFFSQDLTTAQLAAMQHHVILMLLSL